MIYLYKSRNFGSLAEQYLKVSAALPKKLFQEQQVIVPNQPIGRWLKQHLAQADGINANLKAVLPASFSWSLMQQAIDDLPEKSDFDADTMQLNIYKLLQSSTFTRDFPRLHNYLCKSTEADAMVLAGKVSRIFDHYQVYRGDWLQSWEKQTLLGLGQDEDWQQAMWKLLNEKTNHAYRSELEAQLLTAITQKTINLPEAVCVFGAASLPSSFIQTLKALAEYCEVHIFAFAAQEDKHTPAEVEHWQQTGAEFYEQLNIQESISEQHQSPDTSLASLQNVFSGLQTTAPDKQDGSLITVNCFSEMREVEALHDHLISLFAENPSLTPGDVMVALPDLEKYAPFIRAVFDADDSPILYTISGSLAASESVLISGVMELLEIPIWRFTREQIMTLARNRLIQRRFDLSDDNLDQIDNWLDEAGVRWGIDAEHKTEFGLAPNAEHTWRTGLDRLLLGAALPKKLNADLPLYHDVLPVDELEGGLTLMLSRFVNFCELLFSWREVLKGSYSLTAWQLHIQNLIADFFEIDDLEENQHMQLLELLDQLKHQSDQIQFEEAISTKALSVLLNEKVSTTSRPGRLAGMVSFSSMNNLAGIPFKHVCLLGMNYDAWPTQQREPGFDLLQHQGAEDRRCGDRNRGNDERYLTLQLIMSAEQELYCSYVGRNIHNGEKVPPSVMVSELIDCCKRYGIPLRQDQHAMHVYSAGNFSSTASLQSHDQNWLNVAKEIGKGKLTAPPLFSETLESTKAPSHLDIEELCKFFRNPQNSFLRHSLGVYLWDESNDWDNAEPFSLANFADSTVRSMALKQAKAGISDTSMSIAKASGTLPQGMHGEILHDIESEKVEKLLEDIDESFTASTLVPVPIDLNINGTNITGVLRDLRPEGQLLLVSDKYYPYQKIQLWLKHLLLCCAKPEGVACITKVISLSGELVFNEVESPEERLAEWIQAYGSGLQQPLPLFPKVSFAYAENYDETAADNWPAQNAAKEIWEPSYTSSGECSKPANEYLYRGHSPLNELFQSLAEQLIVPIIEAGSSDHE